MSGQCMVYCRCSSSTPYVNGIKPTKCWDCGEPFKDCWSAGAGGTAGSGIKANDSKEKVNNKQSEKVEVNKIQELEVKLEAVQKELAQLKGGDVRMNIEQIKAQVAKWERLDKDITDTDELRLKYFHANNAIQYTYYNNKYFDLRDEASIVFPAMFQAVKELLAENERLQGVGKWYPIETAPKDGSEILVFRPLAKNTNDPEITIKKGLSYHVPVWEQTLPKSVSRDNYKNYTSGSCYATHWQPLPKQPE